MRAVIVLIPTRDDETVNTIVEHISTFLSDNAELENSVVLTTTPCFNLSVGNAIQLFNSLKAIVSDLGDKDERVEDAFVREVRKVASKDTESKRDDTVMGFLASLGYKQEEIYAIINLASQTLFGRLEFPLTAEQERRLKEHLSTHPDFRDINTLVEYYAETHDRNIPQTYDDLFHLLRELKSKVAEYVKHTGRENTPLQQRLLSPKIEEGWLKGDFYFVRSIIEKI